MENRKSGRFVLVRHLSIQHLHFVNRVVKCHGKSYFPNGQKMVKCLICHELRKTIDFVFRLFFG